MYDERTDTPAVAAKYVSFLLGLGGARWDGYKNHIKMLET
jgi:hypothetical protein